MTIEIELIELKYSSPAIQFSCRRLESLLHFLSNNPRHWTINFDTENIYIVSLFINSYAAMVASLINEGFQLHNQILL